MENTSQDSLYPAEIPTGSDQEYKSEALLLEPASLVREDYTQALSLRTGVLCSEIEVYFHVPSVFIIADDCYWQ
jgi:hypothetical protein